MTYTVSFGLLKYNLLLFCSSIFLISLRGNHYPFNQAKKDRHQPGQFLVFHIWHQINYKVLSSSSSWKYLRPILFFQSSCCLLTRTLHHLQLGTNSTRVIFQKPYYWPALFFLKPLSDFWLQNKDTIIKNETWFTHHVTWLQIHNLPLCSPSIDFLKVVCLIYL